MTWLDFDYTLDFTSAMLDQFNAVRHFLTKTPDLPTHGKGVFRGHVDRIGVAIHLPFVLAQDTRINLTIRTTTGGEIVIFKHHKCGCRFNQLKF